MTRVIIEGLRNRQSLINAISVVLRALNEDEAYLMDEHVFVPSTPETPETDISGRTQDRYLTPDPARDMLPHAGPVPYLPCPRRGTHERLTECWMCWSDVMRGAALEPEVLAARWWRNGL